MTLQFETYFCKSVDLLVTLRVFVFIFSNSFCLITLQIETYFCSTHKNPNASMRKEDCKWTKFMLRVTFYGRSKV